MDTGSLAKLFRDIPTGGRAVDSKDVVEFFFSRRGGCKQMHTLPGFSPPILFNAYKIVVKLWGDFENYPQMH